MDNTDTAENNVTLQKRTDIEIEQEIDTDIETELEGEGDIETEGELDNASDTNTTGLQYNPSTAMRSPFPVTSDRDGL